MDFVCSKTSVPGFGWDLQRTITSKDDVLAHNVEKQFLTAQCSTQPQLANAKLMVDDAFSLVCFNLRAIGTNFCKWLVLNLIHSYMLCYRSSTPLPLYFFFIRSFQIFYISCLLIYSKSLLRSCILLFFFCIPVLFIR